MFKGTLDYILERCNSLDELLQHLIAVKQRCEKDGDPAGLIAELAGAIAMLQQLDDCSRRVYE